MQHLLDQSEKELRYRNYSPKTVKAYLSCLKEYFSFVGPNFQYIDEDKIKDFLMEKQDQGNAPQTINLYLNSIKFFYRDVLKTHRKINLRFSKRNLKLPVVLTKKEIIEILQQIANAKHKLIIALSYTAGLRVSEVTNLKVKDINIDEFTIHNILSGNNGFSR